MDDPVTVEVAQGIFGIGIRRDGGAIQPGSQIVLLQQAEPRQPAGLQPAPCLRVCHVPPLGIGIGGKPEEMLNEKGPGRSLPALSVT
ncbi:hypothetical protein [Ponticoccus litoralis]|uniref:PDZ domain-containing protein n=1 Tax=Ponticoccus litoralis TaxID=422297 RepID=A0AAW9SLM4_9RHOB